MSFVHKPDDPEVPPEVDPAAVPPVVADVSPEVDPPVLAPVLADVELSLLVAPAVVDSPDDTPNVVEVPEADVTPLVEVTPDDVVGVPLPPEVTEPTDVPVVAPTSPAVERQQLERTASAPNRTSLPNRPARLISIV